MPAPTPPLDRRELLAMSAALGGAIVAGTAQPADNAAGSPVPRKKYAMKKSINQWAFPYPDKMTLEQCLRLAKAARFGAIELNYEPGNELSPKSEEKEHAATRTPADKIGIRIGGLCSFLFWPYPLTAHDPARRARGFELAKKM